MDAQSLVRATLGWPRCRGMFVASDALVQSRRASGRGNFGLTELTIRRINCGRTAAK